MSSRSVNSFPPDASNDNVGLPWAQMYGHLHRANSRINVSHVSSVKTSLNMNAVRHAFEFKMRVTNGGIEADAPSVSSSDKRNRLKSDTVVATPTITGLFLIDTELLSSSTTNSKFHCSKTFEKRATDFRYKPESTTFSGGEITRSCSVPALFTTPICGALSNAHIVRVRRSMQT